MSRQPTTDTPDGGDRDNTLQPSVRGKPDGDTRTTGDNRNGDADTMSNRPPTTSRLYQQPAATYQQPTNTTAARSTSPDRSQPAPVPFWH